MSEATQSHEVVHQAHEGEAATTAVEGSVVDALFDRATGWLVAGLRAAKTLLESSARTLERTAQSLDAVAARFSSDEAPVDEAAAKPTAA